MQDFSPGDTVTFPEDTFAEEVKIVINPVSDTEDVEVSISLTACFHPGNANDSENKTHLALYASLLHAGIHLSVVNITSHSLSSYSSSLNIHAQNYT